jgi:16S rRNA processing protein RimM
MAMTACRPQLTQGRTRYLCCFEGVEGRDQAEGLRGFHLGVHPEAVDALGDLEDGEFYHHELRGFAVRDAAGAELGAVVGIFATPGQDLIEVQPPDPKAETWYVPFVSAMVVSVDRDARTIVIDPPEGLIP